MKKSFVRFTKKFVLATTLLFAAIVCMSCNNLFNNFTELITGASEDKALVSISCESFDRTALPSITLANETYTYTLSGTKDSGSAQPLLSGISYSKLTESTVYLLPGTWSFTLTAYSETLAVLADTISEKSITADSSNSLAFTLYALTGGTGTLSLTIKYPTGKGVASYSVALYDKPDASDGVDAKNRIAIVNESTEGLTYKPIDGLASGVTKYVRIFFYDANGVCVGSATDAVYVVAGKESTDTIELKNNNLFTVTVLLTKDGSDWTDFSESDAAKTVVVKNNTTDKSYTLTDSTTTGAATGSVPIGTYSIYYGKDADVTNLTDSGIDVSSVVAGDGKAPLDFYSIKTSLCDNVSVADYSGTSPVLSGKPYSFTVTPDAGYTIDTATISTTTVSTIETVTVDGVSTLVYTITSVTQKETITVTDVTKITTLYALGQPLLIVKDGTGTTIYVDTDKDGVKDDDEYSLSHYNSDTVTYPADGADLSAYTVYGGWSGANEAETYITMTGGKIFALYGGCNNAPLSAKSTIIISGGTVVGTVSCAGSGLSGTVSGETSLTISGKPTIGDGNRSGIVLNSITDKYVSVSAAITSALGSITLIGDDLPATTVVDTKVLTVDTVVVNAGDASYVTPGKFVLRRDGATYKTRQYNNDAGTITTKQLVVAGGILVPELNVNQNEAFDYDGNNSDGAYSNPSEVGGIDKATVTMNGTILSIYVDPDDGYFNVASTTLANAKFDMAVLQSKCTYITASSSFTESEKYCYVQFRADVSSDSSTKISMADATTYLRACTFHKTGTSIDVKLCLETVALTEIVAVEGSGATIVKGKISKYGSSSSGLSKAGTSIATVDKTYPDYFNGSFYSLGKDSSNDNIQWNTAYTAAKTTSFNGMRGYLMTITTKPENNYIYYKNFSELGLNAWVGGTRLKNSNAETNTTTPNNTDNFDAKTWDYTEDTDSTTSEISYACNHKWYWVCGPEAGQSFSDIMTHNPYKWGYKESNKDTMYTNWVVREPAANCEPNNGKNDGHQEACLQFVFDHVMEWNDMVYNADGDYGAFYYVIEYSPYENKYGTVSTPTAWAIAVEKTY